MAWGYKSQHAVTRIRGRKWVEIRRRWLQANPLCVECQKKGKVTAATNLDHIKALTNGGVDSQDNYQSLCDECHKVKTAQDLGYSTRKQIGADGWPIG